MLIETLILNYQKTKDDDLFTEIYEKLKMDYLKNINTVAKSLSATEQEVREIFDDTVLYTVSNYKKGKSFANYFKWKYKNKRANLYRKNVLRQEYESLEIDIGEPTSKITSLLSDSFQLEEAVLTKKKADQMALIDFLASGENERTTAIIRAYLTTELMTPTAIGNYLGLNHKQVTRVLNRLAAKFNTTDQFGKPEDWLVA